MKGQGDDIRLTVKYVLGGSDKDLDPCLVEIPEELGTRERKRRTVLTMGTAPEQQQEAPHQRAPRRTQINLPSTKENAQNRKTPNVSASSKKNATQEKKGSVVRRQRRSVKKKPVKEKRHWPSDLPCEIVVPHQQRIDFTSPMTDRGAEDGRKYMLPNARPPPPASSPSTLFAHSPHPAESALYTGGTQDEDPLSESDDLKSEPSLHRARMPSVEDMELVSRSEAKLPIKRVTVKSVVDQEMKQATDFVKDMLQSNPGETVKEESKVKEAPQTSPRQKELMEVFLSLMDHNEGTVEEDCLVDQINDHSSGAKNFREDEINQVLESLATSNKIMRCDDNIFWL